MILLEIALVEHNRYCISCVAVWRRRSVEHNFHGLVWVDVRSTPILLRIAQSIRSDESRVPIPCLVKHTVSWGHGFQSLQEVRGKLR